MEQSKILANSQFATSLCVMCQSSHYWIPGHHPQDPQTPFSTDSLPELGSIPCFILVSHPQFHGSDDTESYGLNKSEFPWWVRWGGKEKGMNELFRSAMVCWPNQTGPLCPLHTSSWTSKKCTHTLLLQCRMRKIPVDLLWFGDFYTQLSIPPPQLSPIRMYSFTIHLLQLYTLQLNMLSFLSCSFQHN